MARKKAVVRMLSGEWLCCYAELPVEAAGGELEALGLDGRVLRLPLAGVKWLCFVREFNSGEAENPERLLRRAFTGRPRLEGVWLRLTLADGDEIEGMAGNDAGLLRQGGVLLTPPDTRGNTQRIFVPAGSIAQAEFVAVVAAARRRPAAAPAGERQPALFD